MNEHISKILSALMPIGGVVLAIIVGAIAYYALQTADVGHGLESDGVTTGLHE